jgi:hypothetical protein
MTARSRRLLWTESGKGLDVAGRNALLAAPVLAALLVAVAIPSIDRSGARATIRACRVGQVRFTVNSQGVNSLTTSLNVGIRTRTPDLVCTVKGYPSLTLPPGNHGSVSIVMTPNLFGARGPERLTRVTRAPRVEFHIVDTRSCDLRDEVQARVLIGLPGGAPSGRWNALFCKRGLAVLAVGPFTR